LVGDALEGAAGPERERAHVELEHLAQVTNHRGERARSREETVHQHDRVFTRTTGSVCVASPIGDEVGGRETHAHRRRELARDDLRGADRRAMTQPWDDRNDGGETLHVSQCLSSDPGSSTREEHVSPCEKGFAPCRAVTFCVWGTSLPSVAAAG